MISSLALLGFYIFERLASEQSSTAAEAIEEPTGQIIARSYRVTNPNAVGVPVRKLQAEVGATVLSRMKRGATLSRVNDNTVFRPDDILTAICGNETHECLIALFGEVSEEALESERGELDYRRIEVSDTNVVGRKLKELNLPVRFGATITRLRRGDVDFVPSGRYRGRARRPGSRADSSEQYQSPYGVLWQFYSFRFRSRLLFRVWGLSWAHWWDCCRSPCREETPFAGGPLIVGLVLGRLQRTGPIIWGMPFSANLTLRQIGLVLFLAGVGTKAGDGFFRTLAEGGWRIALIGAVVTTVSTTLALALGVKLMRFRPPEVMGFVSGIQTQPACLAYASKKTRALRRTCGTRRFIP